LATNQVILPKRFHLETFSFTIKDKLYAASTQAEAQFTVTAHQPKEPLLAHLQRPAENG
jgi:hypothetical protein